MKPLVAFNNMTYSWKKTFKPGGAVAVTGGVFLSASAAFAEVKLRLSHSAPPGSERDVWT